MKTWLAVLAIAVIAYAGFAVKRQGEPPASFSPTFTVGPSNTPSSLTQQPRVLLDVPFTAQAPNGQWSDIRFQDGCEEASSLMAMHWVNRTSISKTQAEQEIIAMSDFEDKTYGAGIYDRSAKDTVQLIKDYFHYSNVRFKTEVTVQDIITELARGNIVLVPMDGQKLGNPYFVAPGPVEHMVVVIGYDLGRHELITNDPGTRHGEHYRYNMTTFESAMRDYPTGFHEPITSMHKNMIVVQPL